MDREAYRHALLRLSVRAGKLSVFFSSFVKQPRAKKDFMDDGGDDDDELDDALDALDEMSMDGQDAEAGLPEERKGIKYMRQLVSDPFQPQLGQRARS